MNELARLRLEVRLTRVVLILATVAFVAGAVIRQPEVDSLSLRRLELVDDDGAVVGSFGVENGQPVLLLSNDGSVAAVRPTGVLVRNDSGGTSAVNAGSVAVINGKSKAVVGAGQQVGLVATADKDGRMVWVSPER